jgi:nucleoside-diphosphate-sugar epimerase
VFGGNGFLGFHVTRALELAGYRVTCINRGNSYWANAREGDGGDSGGGGGEGGARATHVITCDRKKRAAFANAVDAATSALSTVRNDGDLEGGGGGCMEVDGSTSSGGDREICSWDAVVDLSGFTPGDLRAALRGLKGRTNVYVYISSDSVYEVCAGGTAGGDGGQDGGFSLDPGCQLSTAEPISDRGVSRESSAVRPEDVQAATRLARDDRYGHHKLRCEEIWSGAGAGARFTVPDLNSDSSSSSGVSWSGSGESEDSRGSGSGSGKDACDANLIIDTNDDSADTDDGADVGDGSLVPVPWVALRLPDVIGPRDSTTRLWRYQLWLQCADELGPVVVEPALSRTGARRLSLAYAPDVARAVLAVIHSSNPTDAGGGARGDGGQSGTGGMGDKMQRGLTGGVERGRSYNIACREHVSLEELVELIADVDVVRESTSNDGDGDSECGGKGEGSGGGRALVIIDHGRNTNKRRRDEPEPSMATLPEQFGLHRSARANGTKGRAAPSFLPSVDRGPVDVGRALRELSWEPMPLATAVAETVRWFHAVAAASGDRTHNQTRNCNGGRVPGGRHPHEVECRGVARELRRGFGFKPGAPAALALQKRLTGLGFPSPRR